MRARFVLLVLVSIPLLAQQPNFKRSTLTASRNSVVPLDTIDYTLVVRNDGARAPNYLLVALPIPTSTLYVTSSSDWKFNASDRRLEWSGRLEPGASQTLTHTLVVKPESEGTTIATRVDLNFEGAYDNLFHDLDVGTAPSTGGAALFGLRATGCGVALLVHLGITALAIFATRRKFLPGILLISLSAGFLAIFAVMAAGEARFAKHAQQARCTVLDTTGSHVAVRYGEHVSVLGTTGSGVTIGSEEPETFARGETTPCWYDPTEPKRVLLTKSPGGAYLFALIPLATLALGVWVLRRA